MHRIGSTYIHEKEMDWQPTTKDEDLLEDVLAFRDKVEEILDHFPLISKGKCFRPLFKTIRGRIFDCIPITQWNNYVIRAYEDAAGKDWTFGPLGRVCRLNESKLFPDGSDENSLRYWCRGWDKQEARDGMCNTEDKKISRSRRFLIFRFLCLVMETLLEPPNLFGAAEDGDYIQIDECKKDFFYFLYCMLSYNCRPKYRFGEECNTPEYNMDYYDAFYSFAKGIYGRLEKHPEGDGDFDRMCRREAVVILCYMVPVDDRILLQELFPDYKEMIIDVEKHFEKPVCSSASRQADKTDTRKRSKGDSEQEVHNDSASVNGEEEEEEKQTKKKKTGSPPTQEPSGQRSPSSTSSHNAATTAFDAPGTAARQTTSTGATSTAAKATPETARAIRDTVEQRRGVTNTTISTTAKATPETARTICDTVEQRRGLQHTTVSTSAKATPETARAIRDTVEQRRVHPNTTVSTIEPVVTSSSGAEAQPVRSSNVNVASTPHVINLATDSSDDDSGSNNDTKMKGITTARAKKSFKLWTSQEVGDAIRAIGTSESYKRYAAKLEENGVTGSVLSGMTEEQFDQMIALFGETDFLQTLVLKDYWKKWVNYDK